MLLNLKHYRKNSNKKIFPLYISQTTYTISLYIYIFRRSQANYRVDRGQLCV